MTRAAIRVKYMRLGRKARSQDQILGVSLSFGTFKRRSEVETTCVGSGVSDTAFCGVAENVEIQ